ncbi:hypothetical protein [Scytonema sp. PCC 10023]
MADISHGKITFFGNIQVICPDITLLCLYRVVYLTEKRYSDQWTV